jgi:predicted DNA-binding transcriptional regulator YafY
MNRTDRLYALVEELRASAPRARSAQRLAERFEVGVRTIQRDLLALQEAGVPIWATPGPGGGYSIDPGHTLPPLNFTPTEAAAIALAMARSGPMPFGGAARTALHKVVAAMSASGRSGAADLLARIHLLHARQGSATHHRVRVGVDAGDRVVVPVAHPGPIACPNARPDRMISLIGHAAGGHYTLAGRSYSSPGLA